MHFSGMSVEERLNYFHDLMSCNGACYLWTYNKNGQLLHTTCEYDALHKIFVSTGLLDYVVEYVKDNPPFTIISIVQGMLWGISVEKNRQNKVDKIHIYGPICTQELSTEVITYMTNNSKVPKKWIPKFIRILHKIPVKMTSVYFQECIMFHYCVTGEIITVPDIVFQSPPAHSINMEHVQEIKRDRMHTYMAEQELLRMIKEGDLHYKKALQNASRVSVGVKSGAKDALQNAQISQIVFISLCTRAAIEGGLSPEIAYNKGDTYIADVLSCTSVSDAVRIGHTMYEDFIQTVHNYQANPSLSPQIQSCCDYIETHLEEEITLPHLAKRIGYSEYYLSRKFKKEIGQSISEYIRQARINRAKLLLETTQMSIQNISNRLCFGTRSFFADTFHKLVGMPPAEYRRTHQKL